MNTKQFFMGMKNTKSIACSLNCGKKTQMFCSTIWCF